MSSNSSNISWSNLIVSWLRQCSRKFYFGDILATHGRNNKLRRKFFELKQMQNISMWQGLVVDKIMEKHVVPAIASKVNLNFNHFADLAIDLAQRRFKFSEERLYLDRDLTKGEAGDDFCILDTHEIGVPWQADKVEQAHSNIRQAILNIPKTLMPDNKTYLLDYLLKAKNLFPNVQNWIAKIENANVNPQIDLILYDETWKPATIDWKVSASWVSDYSKQLVIIGLVIYLKRLEKADKAPYRYEDIKLFEVNLLKAQVKLHQFNEEIAADMIDFINLTSTDIQLMYDDIKKRRVTIEDFDTTDNQSTCNFCNFKPLCSFLIRNKFIYDEDAYFKSLSGAQPKSNRLFV